MNQSVSLREQFGDIDIYLFDQLLKGRFTPQMSVLDSGCGGGRNLVYFLRNGFNVFAVDRSAEAVSEVRRIAERLSPHLPQSNFRTEEIDQLSFSADEFDAVISSAVLHFASDEAHWRRMVFEMWRVLKPGGLFFSRLASNIGIEDKVQLIDGRRFHLPDGSNRFLVDEELLQSTGESLGATLFEPVKTVIVQNMRAMTTWCMRKNSEV